MKLDVAALSWAAILEAVLAGLALFGGPHGTLGAWPWMLQLPGILLIFFIPGDRHFFWRAGGMLAVQLALWYTVFALVRRAKRGRAGT